MQQSTLNAGQRAYAERVEDIQALHVDIAALRSELAVLKASVQNIDLLRHEALQLNREVLHERTKVRALSEELDQQMNVHRWRKLEGSDPATYSMIQRAHALQKTLIRKTEEVASKDQLIQEKEKLYVELKAILARQPGPEVAEQLTIYQSNLSEKQKQMKAMTSELTMHREQVSDPQLEAWGPRPPSLPHLPLTPRPHPQVSDLQLVAEALATRKTQIKREYFGHRQRLGTETPLRPLTTTIRSLHHRPQCRYQFVAAFEFLQVMGPSTLRV